MRATIIMAFAAVAACSGGTEEKAAEPVAPAASIDAGLWEVTHEIGAITATDHAPATAIKAKTGDKASSQVCVGEANRTKPDPALFAGEGYECSYRDSYIRNGRLNASLTCTSEDLKGEIMMVIDGKYGADSFDGSVSSTSYLPGDGDYRMTSKIAGRHVGACPAEPAGNDAAPDATEGE
ncbi:DUF3617 domain-containing protein [Sphingosinicella rhizophila]|uniref:DUF3617 domain-containing protein n=1 Tax=Sphingosinicella rhizophila TaxID=3050082 RepID=A0ABU3Q8A6_9SPHN|nr:DUF3617 domain-containing protein [Sphingosinicella sp. GR2756]MDT9599203.1 DUF3617 domain-containing protein [Sphingosinicella sp. GR2756]